MMNKMRTARMHIVKFLFMLPLVAVLLIAFRKKEYEADSSRSQLRNMSRTIAVSSAAVVNDTTPKAKANKKQTENRASDHFEITDKKAVIHLHNGKTEEYDLTDSLQRRNFEANYGKIISIAANADDLAPGSVVTESGEAVALSHPVTATTITPAAVTLSPVTVNTATGETVIIAKPAAAVKTSVTTVIAPVTPTTGVTVVDDNGYAVIADEDVLLTITKNTTAQQLEDFKKQMKEKGYELKFDKTIYSDKGTLTHISGMIKSHDDRSDFSASDFVQLILATIKEDNHIHFKVVIKEKPKVVI